MRVLIVLPGALGDVVRALPLLGRLRRAWPDARLAWAVEPPSAPVLEGHPWLDERLVFPRHQGVRAFVPFLRRVRAGDFTLALDLGRTIKSAVIPSTLRATSIRVGQPIHSELRPPVRRSRPAIPIAAAVPTAALTTAIPNRDGAIALSATYKKRARAGYSKPGTPRISLTLIVAISLVWGARTTRINPHAR